MARTLPPPARGATTKSRGPARHEARAVSEGAQDLTGKVAPKFTLPDQDGNPVSLEELRTSGDIVLYFYPKDMTTGCTNEACAFRDQLERFNAAGAQVIGISADSPETHRKFIQKYGLNFALLSDRGHATAQTYRVYKRKSLYGREFMGIERTTFIIGQDGTVRHVFPKVKVNGHAAEVLKMLTGRG